MMRKFKKFLSNKSGNVAIIFSVSLFPALFTIGATVDYSELSRVKARLQETADSAALYAIKGLRDGGYDEEDIDTLAYDNVMSNYDIETSKVEIELDVNADTLSVDLETIYKPAFLKALHYNEIKITAFTEVEYEVVTEAVKCFVALDKSASNALNLVGNSVVGANGCAVHVNSASEDAVDLSGNSSINAEEICIVGDVDSGLNRISPPPRDCAAVSDPFDNVTLPEIGSCDHYDFQKNNNGTLYPGVYCGGITIGGSADVKFQPGLYTIKDGMFSVTGTSILTGDGVSFFLTGDDIGLNFGGSTNFNFTAMSSEELAGFIFYFDPNSDISQAASQFSGDSSTYFEGIFYFGKHQVEINGNGAVNADSPFSIIVADTIKINGNASVTFNVDEANTDLEIPGQLYYRNVTARIVK